MKFQEMQAESINIIRRFKEMDATPHEGMVILAITLAVAFKTDDVSQHEAINRFTTIVHKIYQGETL
jgi:hypothetical protein